MALIRATTGKDYNKNEGYCGNPTLFSFGCSCSGIYFGFILPS